MAVKGWKEFMERVKNKGVIKKFKKGEKLPFLKQILKFCKSSPQLPNSF